MLAWCRGRAHPPSPPPPSDTPRAWVGHRAEDMRRVTVFVEHVFPLTSREGDVCELEFRVLRKTSSGGHKVKIRQVTLESRDAGDVS